MVNYYLKILLRNSNNKLWFILSYLLLFYYPYYLFYRNIYASNRVWAETNKNNNGFIEPNIELESINHSGEWVTVNENDKSKQYEVRYVNGKAVALDLKQYSTLVFGTNSGSTASQTSSDNSNLTKNDSATPIQPIKPDLSKNDSEKNNEAVALNNTIIPAKPIKPDFSKIDSSNKENETNQKPLAKPNRLVAKKKGQLVVDTNLKKKSSHRYIETCITRPFFDTNGYTIVGELPAAQRTYPIVYFRFKKPKYYEDDQSNANSNEKAIEDYINI
ncbi:MAG: hypothetical protein J6Z11_15425 [Candidatus Riflebacteria bacterium]|nr:hypothetical protein [Candidatus Riflebacteria bacterium]